MLSVPHTPGRKACQTSVRVGEIAPRSAGACGAEARRGKEVAASTHVQASFGTMRSVDRTIRLSATDLANHLGCRHLTSLEHAAAEGRLEPPRWRDPAVAILQQRGFEHEQAYVEHLRAQGRSVVTLHGEGDAAPPFSRTRDAMRAGADVIVQATLQSGRWFGRADILLRVPRPSSLGRWSYEVVDTKLARETRAGTILQLCLYSAVVQEIQGLVPERMHIISPGRGFEPESYRVHDFLAYYRLVQKGLQAAIDARAGDGTYPDPAPQCDICRWWPACDRKRRDDDHLCLVAGITKLQTRELQRRDVGTLERLARMPLPMRERPKRGSLAGYERVREQARVQLEGRESGRPKFELLPRAPGLGLARLPEPSPGDVFFDFEGDPFVGTNGREYLLGYVAAGDGDALEYTGHWGLDDAGERLAFERFIDALQARRQAFPDLHVYHFTPYDAAALKRLMGRYATREDALDDMLRAGLFVDLHAILKQSLRAGVEKYSLKELEAFFGFARLTALEDAARCRRGIERALELDDAPGVTQALCDVVQDYNREDCLAARGLRDWLEALRADLLSGGEDIPRPVPPEPRDREEQDARAERVRALAARLLEGVPDDVAARSDEQKARWLLAHLLEWHRREAKAPWWEFFRMLDLGDEDLLFEKSALSGLEFVERVGGTARSPVDRYRFPAQDTGIRKGDKLRLTDSSQFGEVVSIDLQARVVDVKKRGAAAAVHPTSFFEFDHVSSREQEAAVFRLGTWVAENGIDAPGPHRAARDLLLRRPPRLASGTDWERPGESSLDAARRLGLALDDGALAIQGPPGSGKTYTGARMIVDLVRQGRRVGVTAVSHKVVRNLLEAVVAAADEEKTRVRCGQKSKEKDKEADLSGPGGFGSLHDLRDNDAVEAALAAGDVDVVGGTAWLWAREEFAGSVDVLFVDEAGQMSLANVLAVSQAARNLVLLGDPQQLEQPQKGSHPPGTDLSALEQVLDGHPTMPAGHGLFLPETWRLHPGICVFTSEMFYEGRLASLPGLEQQVLSGATPFAGAGLWFVPVEHEGNQSASAEEVERVAAIVEQLTSGGVSWTDRHGKSRTLGLDDVLIVAPYNSQVSDLSERLPGARVGTVDKFQGQEAPVVICSLTTSSPEDAPRGMEFLYSRNRFNVATSRARCACILVANPRLFEPDCRSPRQMQLANAFCRYLELAQVS